MKIKRIFPILSAIIIAVFALQSCDKELQTGTLDFAMSPAIESALKSADNYDRNVVAALVTIVSDDSVKVYDKEYIEFYGFGYSYVTRSLTLNIGNYQLTEFMLLDSANNVIWASPLEGSNLAHMVNDPLPIEFHVYPETTTHLYPEVVRTSPYTPDDFGYVIFNVEFVDHFCIKVLFESFCEEWYADTLIILENGEYAPYYPARLAIFSDGNFLSEIYLNPGENYVKIPRGFTMYELLAFDCSNNLCFNELFGIEELKQFSCLYEEFMLITCESNMPEVIITPEDILEPSIEQGVFGRITETAWDWDTIYFEDSIAHPFIADLYIYDNQQNDSLYYPMLFSDCSVYPDVFFEPLAIVRTNMSGYYQLPLEVGEYSYLVKTDFGFYLDAYISSRIPGLLEVKNGEVTILDIHVSPCIDY